MTPRPGASRAAARPAGEAARDPRAAAGYPSGARTTPVPDLFFSRDLTALDDPLALCVVLWVVWQVHRRPAGAPPAVRAADVAADAGLRRRARALLAADAAGDAGSDDDAPDAPPAVLRAPDRAAIDDRLAAASRALVARGLLLAHGGWLAVNDRAGRALFDEVAAEPRRWPDLALDAAPAAAGTGAHPDAAGAEAADRAAIFARYEATIGLVTPVLADELAEAAATYPPAWVDRAFRLAAANGVRKWSYVRAILARWARDGYEGDDDEISGRRPEAARRPDSEGPYAAWVER